MHSSQLIWACPLLSEHSVSTLKFSYSLSFYFLFLYICFLSQKYYCLISIEKIWYWVLTFSRSFFTFFYNWILFHFFFSLQINLFLFHHTIRNILEKVLNIQKELHWMTTTLACTSDQNAKFLPWFWKMVTNYDRNDTVGRYYNSGPSLRSLWVCRFWFLIT